LKWNKITYMAVASPVKGLSHANLLMCLLVSLTAGDVLTVGEEWVDIAEGEPVGRGSDGEVYTIYATSRSSQKRRLLYCKVVPASWPHQVSYLMKAITYGEPWQLELQKVLVEGAWVKTLGAAYQQLGPDKAVLQLFMEGGGRTVAGIVGAQSSTGTPAAVAATQEVQKQQQQEQEQTAGGEEKGAAAAARGTHPMAVVDMVRGMCSAQLAPMHMAGLSAGDVSPWNLLEKVSVLSSTFFTLQCTLILL
jgi:hypothetical protein